MAKSAPAAIVTGAANGIGSAIARSLIRSGWRVAALDLAGTGLARRFAKLRRAIMIEGDVAQEETAKRAVAAALERFGRIDGVVSNAGISRNRPIGKLTLEEWHRVLDVNLTDAYSATKGALVALTHALAISFAPDVRVNCISPGWIRTRNYAELRRQDHAQHPVGRVGKPQDVAAMAEFLLDRRRAGFITGANFLVDGGMTRKMIYVE